MTNTTDNPVTFDDIKAAYLKSFDKLAAKYGRTRQEFATDLVSSVIVSVMFGRAARKGNVAKAIFWGVSAINNRNFMHQNREDARRAEDMARADKFFS